MAPSAAVRSIPRHAAPIAVRDRDRGLPPHLDQGVPLCDKVLRQAGLEVVDQTQTVPVERVIVDRTGWLPDNENLHRSNAEQ